MDGNAAYARDVLDGLSARRIRARRARTADVLPASLIAVVSAGGAVAFALEEQLTTVGCQVVSQVRTCVRESSEFDGWAYWMIAGAVAGIVALLIGHYRGVRRASPGRWAGRGAAVAVVVWVAALFAGYSLGNVGTELPFVFPAVMTAPVAALALRRGDRGLALGCLALGTAIVAGGMQTRTASGPPWWFWHNLGFVVSSSFVAVLAGGAAGRWYRRDRE